MKRFWTEATLREADGGWRVWLDERPVKTRCGSPQVAPTQALGEVLRAEWANAPDEVQPDHFPMRDLADRALDTLSKERESVISRLLGFADGDTLCYRAEPDEPFWHRQQAVWEPLVAAMERREGVRMERVSGIMHRPLKPETVDRLRARLTALDPFQLAALETLAGLAASICIGLAALEPEADGDALWDASNLEEDWQAERWGEDAEAAKRRARRREAFLAAMDFANAARSA